MEKSVDVFKKHLTEMGYNNIRFLEHDEDAGILKFDASFKDDRFYLEVDVDLERSVTHTLWARPYYQENASTQGEWMFIDEILDLNEKNNFKSLYETMPQELG